MIPDWLMAAGRTLFPVPTTPAGVLEAAVRVAADRLRGKVVTVQGVPMTVVDLALSGDTVGLARGRVAQVRFAARDVAWPGLPVAGLRVWADDVRFAGPLSTRVVVGSVRVRAVVAAEAVAHLGVRFDQGRVWVRLRPWPGEVRVVPEVDDGVLLARPVEARLGRLRVPLRRAPVAVGLPELPHGLRLSAVSVTDEGVEFEGTAPRGRDRLAGTPLAELVGLLATAATTFTVGLLPGG